MSERCSEYMPRGVEWGTLALILGCYGGWLAALWLLPQVSLGLSVLALGVMAALHSSLTHEALHGHPFRSRWLNEALMFFSAEPCDPLWPVPRHPSGASRG